MSILALASAIGMAMAAPASPTPPQMPPQAIEASNAPVICHNETVSGSRVGVFHICMRQADWDARSTEARDYLQFIQLHAATLRP